MRWSQPSKYLKHQDIVGELTLTISGYQEEEVGSEKKRCWVLYFSETPQGLVLNKTNANSIIRLFKTDEMDDWISKRITLYTTEVQLRDEMVEAIRIRNKVPV